LAEWSKQVARTAVLAVRALPARNEDVIRKSTQRESQSVNIARQDPN
jgi:hypothetical protein